MGSDSIAHEAEGLVGYWLRGHEGEKNNAPFTDFFTDFEKKKSACFAVYHHVNHPLFRVRSWKLWEMWICLDCVDWSLEMFELVTPDERFLIFVKNKTAKFPFKGAKIPLKGASEKTQSLIFILVSPPKYEGLNGGDLWRLTVKNKSFRRLTIKF